jgi:hypothetical protein
MDKIELKPGDVVQLNPETCRNPMFAACFLTVTELKTWGVQGYVQGLGQDGKPGGQAYYRPHPVAYKGECFTL